jgi:hypothetical protein
MSECTHQVMWNFGYRCELCKMPLLELYEEQLAENAALREKVERLAEIETALSLFRDTVDRLAKENETLRSQLAAAEERETP